MMVVHENNNLIVSTSINCLRKTGFVINGYSITE